MKIFRYILMLASIPLCFLKAQNTIGTMKKGWASLPNSFSISWPYANVQFVIPPQPTCSNERCYAIKIVDPFPLFVPNNFGPNFEPPKEGFIGVVEQAIKNYEMWIFDRLGTLLYSCTDINSPWNGQVKNGMNEMTVANEDLYIWRINITDVFDKTFAYAGQVTFIR